MNRKWKKRGEHLICIFIWALMGWTIATAYINEIRIKSLRSDIFRLGLELREIRMPFLKEGK